jgi:DEAD/DEAH box helicase
LELRDLPSLPVYDCCQFIDPPAASTFAPALRSPLRRRFACPAWTGAGTSIRPGASGAGFAELGLPRAPVDALSASGIQRPTPIQAHAVPAALAGRDVLGRARTGSAKTLAFGCRCSPGGRAARRPVDHGLAAASMTDVRGVPTLRGLPRLAPGDQPT